MWKAAFSLGRIWTANEYHPNIRCRKKRRRLAALLSLPADAGRLSQKCKHFFEEMQPAASHSLRSHACRLSSIFSKAHVLGKNKFHLIPSSADDGTLRGILPLTLGSAPVPAACGGFCVARTASDLFPQALGDHLSLVVAKSAPFKIPCRVFLTSLPCSSSPEQTRLRWALLRFPPHAAGFVWPGPP